MADILIEIKLKEELVIPLPPLPGILSSFTATPFSSSVIDLGWYDAGLLAVSYDISCSTSPSFLTDTVINIPANPGAGSVYSVTGLTTATTYYFRVRAVNMAGHSAWETASATTL